MRKFYSIISQLIKRSSGADIELLRASDLMDADWYKSNYIDLKDLGEGAAAHYLKRGAAERRNPGPAFDTVFYLSAYPDVAESKINPLVHYLRYGAGERRRTSADQILLKAGDEAAIVCLKPVALMGQMALVVAYASKGKLPVYVSYYLEKLAAVGVSPLLVVATDEPFSDVDGALVSKVGGLYVRADDGQDFSAWAHVIKLNPGLLDLDILILANDHFVGPVDNDAFRRMIEWIQCSEADYLGLTDGRDLEWHIEPYFLALKKGALKSPSFREYIAQIGTREYKSDVFAEHVSPLMHAMAREQLTAEVLFPTKAGESANKTLTSWRELISQGFPLLNSAVIRQAGDNPDFSDWRMVVSAYGFDPSIADDVLAQSNQKARAPRPKFRVSAAAKSSAQLSLKKELSAFSPDVYLHLYPDVGRAGVDPLHHFMTHGQAEGRLGSLTGSERLSEFAAAPRRETILVISHDGTRTGCPVLSFNICKELAKRYNVIALFLNDGPMIASFRAAGIAAVGPVMRDSIPDTLDNVVSYIQAITPLKFAITNSVESRHILPALARVYIPTVSLIHEFGAYITPSTAFRDAVRWAGETVFSTPITRDDVVASWPVLSVRDYPIVPQGRCLPPPMPSAYPASGPGEAGDAESTRVRRVMRPEGFPTDGLVLIGVGTVQMRKGVDLFLDCAAKIKAAAPNRPCRFVWVGHGYNPATDFQYSAYLADQVRRADLSDDMTFLGETTEILEVYAQADLFLLTSRLDPLPNVAIDVMESGIPIVCFSKTTGVAAILTSEDLGEELVAEYLDVEGMVHKVLALLNAPERLRALSDRVRQVARKIFDMERYVSRLEELAGQVAVRVEHERADVETITEHRDLIRFDYFVAPGRLDKRLDGLVREYVRSWASEVDMRKLMPGFHPGVYRVRHGVEGGQDPLADYLRLGRPQGSWSYPVIAPTARFTHAPQQMRVGLHVHAHYIDLLPELLTRLKRNKIRPELLVSITRAEDEVLAIRLLRNYPARVDLRITPNRGRDIGPLFTEFGQDLQTRFDVIGHLHTKKTADIKDAAVGRSWYRFLLENLVGGNVPMADIILSRMAEDPKLGLVFADDPHIVGWDANRPFIEPYLERLSLASVPRHMHVPVGMMFWARPQALAKIFNLRLGWNNYPAEPLPFDGSLLHGLERLIGLVTENAGYGVAGVNCPGVTR